MTTPNIFSMIRGLLETDLFGSLVLFGIFIIFILVVMVMASRVSFKIGALLLLPAFLALFGVGVSEGLFGDQWIIIMIIVAIALGAFAFMWFKLTEG